MPRKGISRRAFLASVAATAGVAAVPRLACPASPERCLAEALDLWRGPLAKGRGEEKAGELAERVALQFEEMWSFRPTGLSQELEVQLAAVLLPGIALYRVLLDEHNGFHETALPEVRDLLARLDRRFPPVRLLRLAPDPFEGLKWAFERLLPRIAPPGGWRVRTLEESEDVYSVIVSQCFCLDTCEHYGARPLAPYFCSLDRPDLASLPAGVGWEMPMALTTRNDVCLFRFFRT